MSSIQKMFWTANEWSKAFFDNLLIFGNTTGFGWSDKLFHCFGHYFLVLWLNSFFRLRKFTCGVLSLSYGILYEIIVDLLILKDGVSKFDLLANAIGMCLGILTLIIWQRRRALV